MTAAAARRIALPRVRLRRPKPRPPWWWWRVFWCAFSGLVAVWDFITGSLLLGAGVALFCADHWRDLARWPEGSYWGPPGDATSTALVLGGLALIIAAVAT